MNEEKPIEIEQRILILRGQRVIIDSDLAQIYGVQTARLNQQVRRNKGRFPEDFSFQLTPEEYRSLILQNATSKKSRGGTRKLPLAFTEHGALMAANVLKSSRAVTMSVYVVRAFIRLRETLALHKKLAHKLEELEKKLTSHDSDIQAIVHALRQLMIPPEQPKKEIGFRVKETAAKYKTKKFK